MRGSFSTAVAARRTEPRDSLDFFPTPPWATRAFTHHVLPLVEPIRASTLTAWDPCCGEGHMALALDDDFAATQASDIHGYGFGLVQDFLQLERRHLRGGLFPADWIIMNPPFNAALDFIAQARDLAGRGYAALVRLQFLEGVERLAEIFTDNPPTVLAIYSERVPMHRGRWVIDGKSATAYCWLVWRHGAERLPPFWILKSRVALSRPDDWLRFSGCVDLPKAHPAMKISRGETLEMEGALL